MSSNHSRNISRLTDIISRTTDKPTIINDASNFVVVTYWWGRGNYNNNTARPCVAFYEQLIQQAVRITVNTALTIYEKKKSPSVYTEKFIEKLPPIIYNLSPYKTFLRKQSNAYLQNVFEHCGISSSPQTNSEKALQSAYLKAVECLEKKKKEGTCPLGFTLMSFVDLQAFFHRIVKEVLYQSRIEIAELVKITLDADVLKKKYTTVSNTNTASLERIKADIERLNQQKKDLKNKISSELKKKRGANSLQFFKEFPGQVNIFDILNEQLRFISPLKFEEMIAKWEGECAKFGCNYLAVEYPEFAAPGGYQLAINAKPMFIKKALELCGNKAIVYIDGDMYIRKYPQIFDIQDVDFMARGWWIDPRSSYKSEESIIYDPYTFETSGGIMYFSQSSQSKFLANKWIEVASMPSQAGKADDRVLSLVFNSQKMLLNMKIIQLPIEYLWLSLDYDERLSESLYNYNTKKMRETIYVEHPECLTTEETAAGAGASSDRTPKFYDFLGDYLVPVSEVVHEYLMFPSKEMSEAFKDYYNYMDGITYLDDGNEDLYKKGFVHPEHPDENESPLYVVAYDKKLGSIKSIEDESLTYNQISELNMRRAQQMRIRDIPILHKMSDGTIEIRPDQGLYKISPVELISLILKLLLDGIIVIYNPVNEVGYDVRYYNKLRENMTRLYGDIELAFVPIIKNNNLADFFKPGINLTQPILFRPENRIMILFMSMYLSLDGFSDALYNGSYEFMSRVRVAYLKRERGQRAEQSQLSLMPALSTQTGGKQDHRQSNRINSKKIDKMLEDQENALLELAEFIGGYKRRYKRSTRKYRSSKKRRLHMTHKK